MSADDLAREIVEHARTFERADAAQKLQELERRSEPLEDARARVLLQALLNVRWVDLAARAGRAQLRAGVTSPGFARRAAQALIEHGDLLEAERVLDAALAGQPGNERAELLGLKGRTDKQRFFDRLRADGIPHVDVLRRSIEAYRAGYALNPEVNGWHGVNLLACISYARRHGLSVDAPEDPAALAQEIIDNLDAISTPDAWSSATRAEALLGLGDVPGAARALQPYVVTPAVTAFNLGSTLRQFEEVWELGEGGGGDDGGDLLVLLRARLSEIANGSVRLAPHDAKSLREGAALTRLEAVFGATQFTSLSWFRNALERCQCVAKVGTDSVPGIGTGWLVRGGDLVESLGDEVLLVTNAHVISGSDAEALDPDDVVVRFQASDCVGPDEGRRIDPSLVFSSPRDGLDVTVARFEDPLARATGLRLAKHLPVVQEGARVLVIGHPGGGDLAFSINDNALLDHDDRYLHYRAPTEGGSSGSPVFNTDWRVVGLHHGGGDTVNKLNGREGTYQANEGIRLDTITAAMRAAMP